MRNMRRQSGRRYGSRRCRGTAAVEFAIVLPLLVTIVLGCVDFGRFAYTYIAVTNAAREGAAFASLNPFFTNGTKPSTWSSTVVDAAKQEMKSGPFFPDQITVTLSNPPIQDNTFKRVWVDVGYPFNTLVPWPMIPHNLTLHRKVQMRVIR